MANLSVLQAQVALLAEQLKAEHNVDDVAGAKVSGDALGGTVDVEV